MPCRPVSWRRICWVFGKNHTTGKRQNARAPASSSSGVPGAVRSKHIAQEDEGRAQRVRPEKDQRKDHLKVDADHQREADRPRWPNARHRDRNDGESDARPGLPSDTRRGSAQTQQIATPPHARCRSATWSPWSDRPPWLRTRRRLRAPFARPSSRDRRACAASTTGSGCRGTG